MELRWQLHMQGVFVSMEDSRLRIWRLCASSEVKAMQNPGAIMRCVIDIGPTRIFMRLDGPSTSIPPFSCPGPILPLPTCPFSGSLQHLHSLLSVLSFERAIRVSYLLDNLRQWFSRYTCSPERNSRFPRHSQGTPCLQTDP